MKRLITLAMLIAALALAACSSAATPAASSEVTQGEEQTSNLPLVSGYPAEDAAVDGYPAGNQVDAGSFSAYPAPYEAGKTTGVAAVDRVLGVLSSSNAADVQALLVYASAGCTTVQGLGGPPPCREGEAEGSAVEGFPVLGSEGSWMRKGEVPADFLTGPLNLLGVYEVSTNAVNDPNYPAGKYAIVVVPAGQPDQLLLLRVDDGGIVRVDHKLDGLATGFSDVQQFILPLQ